MDSEETLISDMQRLEPGPDVLIHGYRLGQVLGRGAQGTVYLATLEGDPQSYAVKLVDIRHLAAQVIDRLVRECELTAKLDHPGIVRVYEAGYWGDHIFIVMEVALGRAADRFANGALGWRRAVEIARQAAVALAHAHAHAHDLHGVIHRDIKPANLVIELDGQLIAGVKIVDFGLSRSVDDQIGGLTMTGAVMGTPFYMSPEQCVDAPPSRFMDIYAIGCMFFHLVTGRTPYQARNAAMLMISHMQEPPPTFDGIATVGKGSQYLLKRCLAKNPKDRSRTMRRSPMPRNRPFC